MILTNQDQDVNTQAVARSGNAVADLQDGPVKVALHCFSPLCRLLQIGLGTIGWHHLFLVEGEGKVQAQLLFPVRQPHGTVRPAIPWPRTRATKAVATNIIVTYLDVARRNEVGITAGYSPECLHHLCIALCKVRSVGLLKGVHSDDLTETLQRAKAHLMRPIKRMRDLDMPLLTQVE